MLLQRAHSRYGGGFPYSPTGALPPSPPSPTTINFLLQQESQRAAAAAAAALILGGDEVRSFMGLPRMERGEFAGMLNPGSRKIYHTFPAESTFREEDVSNYFSIYGPVKDVRIPYQQNTSIANKVRITLFKNQLHRLRIHKGDKPKHLGPLAPPPRGRTVTWLLHHAQPSVLAASMMAIYFSGDLSSVAGGGGGDINLASGGDDVAEK